MLYPWSWTGDSTQTHILIGKHHNWCHQLVHFIINGSTRFTIKSLFPCFINSAPAFLSFPRTQSKHLTGSRERLLSNFQLVLWMCVNALFWLNNQESNPRFITCNSYNVIGNTINIVMASLWKCQSVCTSTVLTTILVSTFRNETKWERLVIPMMWLSTPLS